MLHGVHAPSVVAPAPARNDPAGQAGCLVHWNPSAVPSHFPERNSPAAHVLLLQGVQVPSLRVVDPRRYSPAVHVGCGMHWYPFASPLHSPVRNLPAAHWALAHARHASVCTAPTHCPVLYSPPLHVNAATLRQGRQTLPSLNLYVPCPQSVQTPGDVADPPTSSCQTFQHADDEEMDCNFWVSLHRLGLLGRQPEHEPVGVVDVLSELIPNRSRDAANILPVCISSLAKMCSMDKIMAASVAV